MTLPKTFTLASEDFDSFDTMSLGAGHTISTINPQSRPLQELQLQEQQQQLVRDTTEHRPFMPSSSSPSSLPLIQNSIKLDHNTMFDVATTPHIPPATETTKNNFDVMLDNVMPGIYLTKNFMYWKRDELKAHGFTHVIIIDKHIQELYYPHQQPDIFKLCPTNNAATKRDSPHSASGGIHDDSSSINAFDDYYPPAKAALNFGKEFEVIDLNFGEKSYLTTVLPNCYRAVKFINKALQSGGTILVIDCNGGEQKCLTIVVAYLMYKHNISFSNAFARLKEFYKKADLNRFYISQLYEYEPILQVQRAQSRGHSCSRELHAAILKRKKPHDDDGASLDNTHLSCFSSSAASTNTANTSALLDNCNPLNRFDATQMERPDTHSDAMGNTTEISINFTRFMSGPKPGGWYNWDDYAME